MAIINGGRLIFPQHTSRITKCGSAERPVFKDEKKLLYTLRRWTELVVWIGYSAIGKCHHRVVVRGDLGGGDLG